MSVLRSPEDYELFLYTLAERFPSIRQSTLVPARRGATLGRVSGELLFAHGYRITVRERLLFDRIPATIDWYGYGLWRGDEKMCWYDPQPHPGGTSLESTHPHHKYILPDMKHHRIPAPEMSFTRENLSALITEIETAIAAAHPLSP